MHRNIEKDVSLTGAFTHALLSLKDEQSVSHFLNEIFTDAERRDLELRWQLLKMLHNKIPQRRIASELGISLCKITRGSKLLRQKNSMVKAILDSTNINKEDA